MSQPFVSCDHSTTEGYKTMPNYIRVLLNPDVKIYQHEYKGIKFFVSRDVTGSPTAWKSTEIKTGSTLERYPYRHSTKKGCIAETHELIDMAGTDRINELIEYVLEKHKPNQIMPQDEYMKWRDDS